METQSEKVVVVLSGGQDSTTCLYWALDKFGKENVVSLTFDYGQRHRIELASAKQVAEIAGVDNLVLPINTFSELGGNSLTGDIAVETSDDIDSDGEALPNTFVPGRNLIFLNFAGAYAYKLGAKHLVIGVAQTDYSGYPDCREPTIKAIETALCLGMEHDLSIHTPLMNLSKAQTIELAQELGAMPAMAYSHTCYNGAVPPCGECQACVLRAKGFAEAGIDNPLVTRYKKS